MRVSQDAKWIKILTIAAEAKYTYIDRLTGMVISSNDIMFFRFSSSWSSLTLMLSLPLSLLSALSLIQSQCMRLQKHHTKYER